MLDPIPATSPNWHPIESAPRDGTHVLLFYPELQHPMHVGFFYTSETFEYGRSARKIEYWMGGPRIIIGDRLEPTHWMPLPRGPNGEMPL